MSQPKVVIELRPRLQSCHVYYRVDPSSIKDQPFFLQVKQSALTFKCDLWEETYKFDSVNLKPAIVNNLKPDEEGVITCRLQTLVSIEDGCYKDDSHKYTPDLISGESVQITCRFCHSSLLKNPTSFNRILPLPSSELSPGDLFCHPCTDEHFNCSSSSKIEPKLSDLLFGSYFFKVNSNITSESKIFTVNGVVYCQQCRTWIGTKDGVSVKMWNCTVAFNGESDSEVFPREDFESVMKSTLEDSLGTTCKLVVTHKAASLGSSEFLLLWIMDRSLSVLVSCEGSDRLVRKSAIKLLYSHERSDSNLVPQWQKDPNTNFLDVAQIMFTEGLKYLEQTNSLFPKLFRKANDMNVGYLGI